MGLAGAAAYSYRRPFVPLTPLRRGVLIGLRAAALIAVFLFACRPIMLLPPENTGDLVVPVIVDASRSMRIEDADGGARLAEAQRLVTDTIAPALEKVGRVELFRADDTLSAASLQNLTADGRRSDLAGAVDAVRERFKGRRVPGIVVLSDGGDTEPDAAEKVTGRGVPVFAVGIGSVEGLPDREVAGVTAGDPRLDQALVDLHVTTVAHGFNREAYALRLLANGQLVESRRIVPAAEGTPSDETFAVTPDPLNATVYTAEIAADPAERITENNSRTMLLSPAGRKRRLLVLGGSPGYEHSFLVRALAEDPSFEVDSIVRKGKDDSGRDTFLIQAAGNRGAGLISGFPTSREALFAYDAVIIGNLEGDFFGRNQMELLAAFVSTRGGGLLLMGGRSFLERGIAGSPLEEALPLELNDRRGGAATRASDGEGGGPHNAVTVTPAGAVSPIMRIAPTPEETRKQWAALPALAAVSPVGGPRPGATVLAVTQSSNGALVPLVAIQRYGRGRSMVFSGEAAWRWKMLRPSTDRTYELFWRQAARWLSSDAPDPVSITVPDAAATGDSITVQLDVRDARFEPVDDAAVEATLTAPGAGPAPIALRPAGTGVQRANFVADTTGLYRLHAEARRGPTPLGAADKWFYVGGSDPEYVDPRLNEGFLRRLARRSGGQYVRPSEVDDIVRTLTTAMPSTLEPVRRDLWHQPWAFALVVGLLAAEWVVRRAAGMR
jgi:uncharacterized membrane protein